MKGSMKKKCKLNNKGSSFLTIIACFIIVSMLAMLLLNIVFFNVNVKKNEEAKKAVFYDCETAVNEITTGLKQTAIDCIQNSYISVLEVYTTNTFQDTDPTTGKVTCNKTKLMDYYYNQCISNFSNAFGITAIASPDIESVGNRLHDFLVTDAANVTIDPTFTLTTEVAPSGEHNILIKNLSISYKNGHHYSTITTDLTVKFPTLDIQVIDTTTSTFDLPYKEYAIIAEGGIEGSDGSIMRITGNLYAGENGIVAKGDSTALILSGKNIITKGTLSSKNRAILQVNSFETERPNIWAKSLSTESETTNTSMPTVLELIGRDSTNPSNHLGVNCYIADDLEMYATYSNVKIDGNYIGYSTTTNKYPKEEGSSICVNGEKSTLEITGEKLALGGFAFISFPQNLLGEENNTFIFDRNSTAEIPVVPTGESIGIKNNQNLYLVPEKYMKTQQNPMPYTEYKKYVDKGDSLYDLAKMKQDYNNSGLKIMPIIYSTVSGMDKVVYFYAKFERISDAINYFHKCKQLFPTTWDKKSTKFKLNEVSIQSSNIYAAGNVVDYKIDGTGNVKQTELAKNAFTDLDKVNGKNVARLKLTYANLYRVLLEDLVPGQSVALDENPYNYYVDASMITANKKAGGVCYNKLLMPDLSVIDYNASESVNAQAHVILTDGDYIVDKQEKGIIIANGDVTVRRNFTGLIMAKGKVTICTSARVTYDKDLIQKILYNCSDLVPYLKNTTSTNVGSGVVHNQSTQHVGLDDIVTISNWRSFEQ